MDRLNSVKPTDRTSAAWANAVIEELRRLNIIPGNGIKKTVTSKGTRIDLDIPAESGGSANPATDSCFPVFITGYVGNGAYTGALYRIVGKNYNNSSSDEGASNPLYFPHVTPQTTIPIGCTILAHRIEAPSIQSSTDN